MPNYWNIPGVPHKGWSLDDIIDVRADGQSEWQTDYHPCSYSSRINKLNDICGIFDNSTGTVISSMKFILFLLISLEATCQQEKDSSINYKYFAIGDSIIKYDGQTYIIEHQLPFPKDSNTIFQFSPAETNLISVGDVKFDKTALVTNSTKKVDKVFFSKGFETKSGRDLAIREFNYLVDFMSTDLKIQPEIYGPCAKDDNLQFCKCMRWLSEKAIYQLNIGVFKKKHQETVAMLSLSLYR